MERKQVDIAIITPTGGEWLEMLEQISSTRPVDDGPFPMKMGTIGSHSVLCCASGKGQEETASSVTLILERAKPKWLFLVGIAGGLNGIQRGDVIVAHVIHSFDYGKLVAGSFKRRPENDFNCDRKLLAFADAVAASKEQTWRSYVREPRPDGNSQDLSRVHVDCYVASSNKVVDDPDHTFFKTVAAAFPEIHAVEMEGIGAGASARLVQSERAMGLLMIRGISDEPGTNTGDGREQRMKWRTYAAAVAAAFTRNVIEQFPAEIGFSERGHKSPSSQELLIGPFVRPFEDRRSVLFGRAEDVDFLVQRSRTKGLTAIVGRPQMGKSWLLTEVCRSLTSDERNPGYLVGFAEAVGETHDLVLRSVTDLYTRWLSDATQWPLARVAWESQIPKGSLIGSRQIVTKIFDEINSAGGPAGKLVGPLVKKSFEELVAANRDFFSRGVQIPQLQYEQARDLVSLASDISGRHIVLVLDQWEKSPSIDVEQKILMAFLKHSQEWPTCHVFLTLRPNQSVLNLAQEFEDAHMGTAVLYQLGLIGTDHSADRQKMLEYLRREVPATVNVSEARLLQLIGGNPAIIYRWTSPFYRNTMAAEDLEAVATKAITYQYSEFKDLLQEKNLKPFERSLAIRLALAPTGTSDSWSTIAPLMLGQQSENLIDDLKEKGVLESVDPPSFGHEKRHESALQWFIENRTIEVRTQLESLALEFGKRIRSTGPDSRPFIEALDTMSHVLDKLESSSLTRLICNCATSFSLKPDSNLPKWASDSDSAVTPPLLDQFTSLSSTAKGQAESQVAPLLAMALFWMSLVTTKTNSTNEDNWSRLETRWGAMLETLRRLAALHPKEESIRERLVAALSTRVTFSVVLKAMGKEGTDRAEPLLRELRQIAEAHPDEPTPRMGISHALSSLLSDVKTEQQESQDALLEEARQLALSHPKETDLQVTLAKSLGEILDGTYERRGSKRWENLLAELRELAEAHPGESEIRQTLAGTIANALTQGGGDLHVKQQHVILEELRRLAHENPADSVVRQRFAEGLATTIRVSEDGQRAQLDEFLSELRRLAEAHPEESVVRGRFAEGLANTIVRRSEHEQPEERDALLVELRRLTEGHPEDAITREAFAAASAKVLIHTGVGGQFEQRSELLTELRELAQAHPEESSVRQRFVEALADTAIRAGEHGQSGQRDTLLTELGGLVEAHPAEPNLRKSLAHALVSCLTEAEEGQRSSMLADLRRLAKAYPNELALTSALATALGNSMSAVSQDYRQALQELRQLASAHTQERTFRESLAAGLANALNHARQPDEFKDQDDLLQEMRDLAAAYPDETGLVWALGFGLEAAFSHAAHSGQFGRQKQLLEELRSLAAKHSKYHILHFWLGNTLKQNGRIQEAVAAYRTAIDLVPDFAQGHYELARLLAATGELDNALFEFRRTIELNPDSADCYFLFGMALVQSGRSAEAIAAYRKAIELQANFGQARYNLALVLKETGQRNEAIVAFQEAIKSSPDDPVVQFGLGTVLAENGRLTESITTFRKAVALSPGNVSMLFGLGIALAANGQVEEAIAVYREAIALQPDSRDLHRNLAVLLFQNGNIAESIVSLRKLVDLNPEDVDAHLSLGIALAKTEHAEEAITEFRKAISLEPSRLAARQNLAHTLAQNGQFAEALVAFRELIEADPKDATAHFNFGSLHAESGNVEEAIAAYKSAIALQPELWQPFFQLGAIHLEKGQTEEAIMSYRKVVELEPDHAGAHLALGRALGKADQVDEAVDEYKKAAELDGDDANSLNDIGWELANLGRCTEAISYLEKALLIDPYDPNILDSLGFALAGTGQYEAAVVKYKLALQGRPQHAPFHLRLAQALEKLGRKEEADWEFKEAYQLSPELKPFAKEQAG